MNVIESKKLLIINNYWMRLSMISIIIQTKVNLVCRRETEADNIDQFDPIVQIIVPIIVYHAFNDLKISETYKMIKRSLLMFQVYYNNTAIK
jgi:hypothetical protein